MSNSSISVAGNTMANVNNSNMTMSNGSSSGYVLTTSGASSGSITFNPNINTGYIYTPGVNVIGGSTDIKYHIFKLPINKMPEAVFVCGRMVTLGILGSDVECAYTGTNQLIFATGILSQMRFNDKLTLIIQYSDKMYHYNVEHLFGNPQVLPDTNIVQVKLLSEIARNK